MERRQGMTRRLALTIAAGVAAALMAAATAFIIGRGPAASSAPATRPKPIVKTTARMVAVHKEARAERSRGRPHTKEVVRSSDPSQSRDSVGQDSDGDDGFQHDNHRDDSDEDDGFQHDNHQEDDGFQHESEGGGGDD